MNYFTLRDGGGLHHDLPHLELKPLQPPDQHTCIHAFAPAQPAVVEDKEEPDTDAAAIQHVSTKVQGDFWDFT